MKKLIAVVLLALFLGAPAMRAQMPEERNEICVSWGAASIQDFAMGLGGIFVTIFTLGFVTFDNPFSTGNIGVEYYRTLNKTFSVGGMLCGLYGGADTQVRRNGAYEPNGQLRYISATLMPAAKIYWFRKPHVSMYSKLGAGVSSIIDVGDPQDLPELFFAFQASPISVEVGGIRDRGFVELGLGMQGLLSAGWRHAF